MNNTVYNQVFIQARNEVCDQINDQFSFQAYIQVKDRFWPIDGATPDRQMHDHVSSQADDEETRRNK